MRPEIKICCIGSVSEAKMAIGHGASAIGLVAKMPSGPGMISDELIREIALVVPPSVGTFLLTSETSAEEIIEHHRRTLTNTIQIVDQLKTGTYETLKKVMPSIKIVQVIHVLNDDSVDEALRISESVDVLLLDSGNPNLHIKILGGTGRVHNWALSRKIVEQSGIPVYLAGGLNPANVRDAIEQVHPFGLDVCNGVRTHMNLDPAKLELFFRNAWK
jgi:phosphoribosylanthranilate isomerase